MSNNFAKKTILITGGAGFIGSNIANYLQDNYPSAKIVVFDCFRNEETLSNGNLKSFGHFQNLINYKGDIICGNLNNYLDLAKLQDYSFDVIFHLAAISDTRASDQELVMRTNVNSFYYLLDLAKQNNAPIIYASSAATYGNNKKQIIGNEAPENTYGYSKLAMDNIANKYSKEFNVLTIGLRYFNVYGKGEFFKDKTASMVLQLGHQILAGNNPKLFKDSGNFKRDFVYIDDVISATTLCYSNYNSTKTHNIYNIGYGKAKSFNDIAMILFNNLSLTKTATKIDFIKNPYNDNSYQTYTCADIKSATKDLTYKPKFNLEDGIANYISAIKNSYAKYK